MLLGNKTNIISACAYIAHARKLRVVGTGALCCFVLLSLLTILPVSYKGNDAEAISINSYLKSIKVKLYEKEIELINRGFVVTAELLKDAYLDRVDSIKEKTLLDVFKEHNDAQRQGYVSFQCFHK